MGWSRTLPLYPKAVTGQLDNTSGRVVRASFRNLSTTTEAVFRLFDGTGPTGPLLDTISLAPKESTRDYYRAWEYPFDGGLYVQVVSGTFEGTIVVHHSEPGEGRGDPVIVVGNMTIDIGTA